MRIVVSAFSPALTSNPRPDPTSPAYITHSPSSLTQTAFQKSRFPAPSLIPPSAFALALQVTSTPVLFQSNSIYTSHPNLTWVLQRKELGKTRLRHTRHTTHIPTKMDIRVLRPSDIPHVQLANITNLPENYFCKYYLYHAMSWPQLSYVAVDVSLFHEHYVWRGSA